jgi:hypothetical protein
MTGTIFSISRIVYHLEKFVFPSEKALIMTLLDETWRTLPAPARESLVEYWSQTPATIKFRDHLIEGFNPKTGGQTRDCGRLIIYRHDYLLALAPNLARALIAHEFAHAYVCCNVEELMRIKAMAEMDLCCEIPFNGTWDQFGLDPDSADTNFRIVDGKYLIFKESYFMRLNEKRVRQINRAWGFDEDALSE